MNSASIDIVRENEKAWNQVYAGSPRLRYPDNFFIHYLMKYTDVKSLKRGVYVGAGDGADALAAASLGIHMECLDISDESVARLTQFAKDDGLSQLVHADRGDQRDLSRFKDEQFDLAGSWSVISYLNKTDGQQAIREIHRVLKKGGAFIGILESTKHTGYLQDGVKHIEGRTYQMPSAPNQTKADLVMTYYDRDEVNEALKSFSKVSLGHRLFHLPPDAKKEVGQWMFCAIK